MIFQPKILTRHAQIYSKKLADIFNESINIGKFPDILKRAEVASVYKKDDMNDKQNYRPVSTSNLSKVFEKPIYSQINTYMSGKFSKYLTGFRKNHNTQHALIIMIENYALIIMMIMIENYALIIMMIMIENYPLIIMIIMIENYPLIIMIIRIENWKSNRNKGNKVGAIFVNLCVRLSTLWTTPY